MYARTIAFATLMLAATIAFGGMGETDVLVQDAAASCTYVDEIGCLENVCYPIAALYERVTGQPAGCVE